MSFNIIQIYLRKSVIAISLLVGMVVLALPQASYSAELSGDFTIEFIPDHPTTTELVTLRIRSVGCYLVFGENGFEVDALTRKINVSIQPIELESTLLCAPAILDISIGLLQEAGIYEISFYEEGSASSGDLSQNTAELDLLYDENFIGTLNLSVSQGVGGLNPIPLFSTWMNVAIILMLLLFAMQALRKKGRL
jgi:hypothetical protein